MMQKLEPITVGQKPTKIAHVERVNANFSKLFWFCALSAHCDQFLTEVLPNDVTSMLLLQKNEQKSNSLMILNIRLQFVFVFTAVAWLSSYYEKAIEAL